MTATHLGDQLKYLRHQHHLTQTALANQLHVSRQSISSWETGRYQPDITTIQQIADFYQISMDTLVANTPTKQSANHDFLSTTSWLLLAVLIIERITQFSTTSGFFWIDGLTLILVGLIVLKIWLIHKHQFQLADKLQLWGLGLFSIISFVSGTLNLFSMGFGLMTTCQFCGLVALAVVIRHHKIHTK